MNKFRKLIAVAALVASPWAMAETAIVVNPANQDKLGLDVVERIFTGKTKTFPSGAAATPINQPEASPLREAFETTVLKKNASQMKAYWSKLIFTGKGHPPAEMDAAAVKAKVASDPSAIGYIDASEVNASVREVARF